MKLILGMAKSSLDMTGAKAQKIELDVLRLIHVVQALKRQEHDARGYMLVLAPALEQRVSGWLRKYKAESITCSCHPLTWEERALLEAEKARNRAGLLARSEASDTSPLSDAGIGQNLGELALHRWIAREHPEAEMQLDDFPFEIRWDYYGIVKGTIASAL